MNPPRNGRRRLVRATEMASVFQLLISRRRRVLSRSAAIILALYILARLLLPRRHPKEKSSANTASVMKMTRDEVAKALPGFRAVNHQIYVQDPALAPLSSSPAAAADPTEVLIYGWGDAQARTLSKYVVGYRTLFPAARLVVVMSSITHILLNGPDACATAMEPLVAEIFGRTRTGGKPLELPSTPVAEEAQKQEQHHHHHHQHRILIHAMSNTGAVNKGATLEAYRRLFPSAGPMPTRLAVLDSNPGSTDLVANVWKYADAVAIGASRQTGVPRLVVRPLAALFLVCVQAGARAAWGSTSSENSERVSYDPGMADPAARRVYVYSREDPIVEWADIEVSAEESSRRGWHVEREVFEGSGHCEHMRKDPERYWGIVQRTWEGAVGEKGSCADRVPLALQDEVVG